MHDSGQERERQKVLSGYNVLDTPNELHFDPIAKDAARILGAPIDSAPMPFTAHYL